MPGTILGTWNSMVIKTDKNLCLHGACIWVHLRQRVGSGCRGRDGHWKWKQINCPPCKTPSPVKSNIGFSAVEFSFRKTYKHANKSQTNHHGHYPQVGLQSCLAILAHVLPCSSRQFDTFSSLPKPLTPPTLHQSLLKTYLIFSIFL